MVNIVALKRLRYPRGPDGKQYGAGDEISAVSERDAKALTLVRAARYSDKIAPAQPKILTANLKAENEQKAPAPRRYRRRDLRSEE